MTTRSSVRAATRPGKSRATGKATRRSVLPRPESLEGAGDNEDTFVFGEGGALDGEVRGGDGGFDSVVVENDAALSIALGARGPDSGTIAVDGNVITYSGMEPVKTGPADDVVFTGTTGNDDITVRYDVGMSMLVIDSPSVETHSIPLPGNSLTIDANDGNDTITIETLGLFAGS